MLEHVAKASEPQDADFQALMAEVPIECKFEAGGKNFQFANTQVHSALSAIVTANEDDRAGKIAAMQTSLARLSKALDEYSRPLDPTVQPKLKQILTRSEFKRVGTQDTDAIVREQIMKLMIALFSLIAKNPEQAAFFAKVFTWTAIGLVLLYVLWKVYRWVIAERPLDAPREIIPFAPSAKSWQQWMREARTALAKGELREAVHSSYWAAISHLESSGAWTPDKARTPREYLRLISSSNPARPSLAEISRIFEVVWYGERVPAQEECEAFLTRVEQIACR